MNLSKLILFGLICTLQLQISWAKDYYLHPRLGDDEHEGTSKEQAFRSLSKIEQIKLRGGDRVFLAAGEVFQGSLVLLRQNGDSQNPIEIQSVDWSDDTQRNSPATIDASGFPNGILIENSSYIRVKGIRIKAEGPGQKPKTGEMRVGVLVTNTAPKGMSHIELEGLSVYDVFYEEKGVSRGKEEVRSANGTQKYGWGIRVISGNRNGTIENVKIHGCSVENVSHTGIKLTGGPQLIRRVQITDNLIKKTGGPGIQMSGVKFVHVLGNEVDRSGSEDDSRKWGRGSGLWTWSSSNVLIEKNRFLNANGPGDSAGAHIDYNCDNIVLQYNFSANNAGGFCEILGNNYNCAYRYNISVNDGHRVKGEDGAFQEGKIFWLSGYQGNKMPRKGPVNSYFYNNTIYVNKDLVAKMAIDNTSNGVLVANNIFHIQGESQAVMGDQYKPDEGGKGSLDRVIFRNNLFLKEDNWPSEAIIKDKSPKMGDAEFINPGGFSPEDYTPNNSALVKGQGIRIPHLENDGFGLIGGLKMKEDFLGNPIGEIPGMGAIEMD